MEFCPHCMQPTEGKTCTHCNGEVAWKAPPGQLPVGTQLRGSTGTVYMIGAAKGQGGFGITYAAMDMMKGKRVAIKEYFPTRCAIRSRNNMVSPVANQAQIFQGGKKSFLEEAMMLSAVCALKSVVSVRDYFETNGTAYLVMEYVDGIPLHEVLRRGGVMKPEVLMPKLPKLLEDLHIMHNAKVIHRDISPDNLMLMPDGTLKLLDFGSARSVQDGKSMTVMLKAGFSPVEQYQSKGQGSWTDVYALAATIYYCLTGVIPPSATDRLIKDSDPLKTPSELGVHLTPQQEKALLLGMTVQPKNRPQTMEAFSNALFGPKQIKIPEPPIPTPDPNPGPKEWIPGISNKTLLIIAAIAGGCILMAIFIALLVVILRSL